MMPLQIPAASVSCASTEPGLKRVMGLTFRNCIGIAAGVDRDGSGLAGLASSMAGHIEVGTVTDPRMLRLPLTQSRNSPIVGVNIASPRAGFSGEVVADYRNCLRSSLPSADYVVLNFSNKTARRTMKSDGGHRIVSMARNEISRSAGAISGHIPLLAKLPAGAQGEDLPVTQSLADELDGFVLVGEQIERLVEFRAAFPRHGIVSVGGIRCAEDVLARRQVGCDLVQVHGAYAHGGAMGVARIVHDFEGSSEDD